MDCAAGSHSRVGHTNRIRSRIVRVRASSATCQMSVSRNDPSVRRASQASRKRRHPSHDMRWVSTASQPSVIAVSGELGAATLENCPVHSSKA